MVIGSEGRYVYPTHLLTQDRDNWWIQMDHCYARPWNWRPESTFLRPTKTLFMPKAQQIKKRPQDCDDDIDVVTENDEPIAVYDKAKAIHLMEECERHASLARIDEGDNDWEESISRANWTITQNRLFNGMVNILNADHLARLTYQHSHNEPIARRTVIDKSVERVRKLMATISWESKYTQWLHQLLIDNLSTQYLTSYLDILQTLRSKLPTFVDKMMGAAMANRLSLLSYESLFPLLKRPWDPVAQSLMQDKPKKLPGNPLIIVVPSTPISSKRMLKWINLLSNLATVITIPSNYAGAVGHKTTLMSCVDHMFVMTRNKIQDLRLDYPGRNIVLVGFGFGATLALQIAQVEQVLCVVSLGFSLFTADGRRGEPDDNLLELQCPVLFVIGQCSSTSHQEDMEDLRERMRVETGLIIVGAADHNLRVSKKKKRAEGITQSIVDRCITDEIGEFISGLILSPYPPQVRQSPTNLTVENPFSKKLKERKRYNSNTSSVDSEPASPTSRITRPVGRPPGSKKKLEAKWAAQGTLSTPSNSPPPPSQSNTPDTSSNDSNLVDKNNDTFQPIKKIKTLKPALLAQENTSPTNTAKAMGLVSRSMSGLLPGEYQQAASKTGTPGIRVLDNIKLPSTFNTKLITSSGKLVDMSKMSIINPKSSSNSSLVLMPDGKIKTLPGRYITSKRQLIGTRAPKPVKKISYLPTCSMQVTNLAPPPNLTSQDIMDLPIIFADDNQILDASLEMKPQPAPPSQPPPSRLLPVTGTSKFMFINKPNLIITPVSKNVTTATKVTPKYTKIILSSKKNPPDNVGNVLNLSSDSAAKNDIVETASDLEKEIAATTVYKSVGNSDGNMEIVTAASEDVDVTELVADAFEVEVGKRSSEEAESGSSPVKKMPRLQTD